MIKTTDDATLRRRPRTTGRAIGISAALLVGGVILAEACGSYLVFRAYLEPNFWQPLRQRVEDALTGLPPEPNAYKPYAGMAPGSGSVTVQQVRDEYRAQFPNDSEIKLDWPAETVARLRSLMDAARPANAAERDELELLRCKADLRGARIGDDASLAAVQSCLESYLAQDRPTPLISEARGWLARAQFLRGQQAKAAKIYLNEIKSADTNIRRNRLIESLAQIEPTPADLEEYFDTPEHALFAANRIPSGSPLAAAMVTTLERRRDLFQAGPQSDALAMALMRLTTQTGAPSETLRYSNGVGSNSELRRSPEFNWLVGAARYQLKDYSGAETALLRVLDARADDAMHKAYAANALIGVYSKLNRPVDQLWAAFQAESLAPTDELQDVSPLYGLSMDLAYLLDVQLSDAGLEEYLMKRPDTDRTDVFPVWRSLPGFTRSAVVRYALGVRRARREEYAEALRSIAGLPLPPAAMTARSWNKAAELFANTRRAGLSQEQKLQALYDYAFFLSQNENKVFFNDTLWFGFQRYAFITTSPPGSPEWRSLPETEKQKLISIERKFRDEQEEYWRSYQIFDRIVQEAGPAPIGGRAAERALYCLRRINTDRFGRADEIQAAEERLTRRLSGRGD
jgi:hypothetical protein